MQTGWFLDEKDGSWYYLRKTSDGNQGKMHMVAQESTKEQLTDLMIRIGRIQAALLCLILAVFLCCGHDFLHLWVGKTIGTEISTVWAGAALVLVVLLIPLTQNTGIAILQAVGYYFMMRNYNLLASDATGIWPALVIVVSFIAGSSFVMWMGEQITEFGIGNGISIILFAGILSRVPSMVSSGHSYIVSNPTKWWAVVLVVLGILALIVLVTWVNGAERRIPVQYAKRQVGRKMYGGQASTLPMKVNMSGVLPIIFAQSIATLPATIAAFTGHSDSAWASTTSIPYAIIYFLLIIFFAYFYSTIQFNPVEVANNLKKNGGYIPGFRPGKPTSEFIKKVLNKITLFGAIYLGIIAIVPILISHFSTSASLSGISLGGTSIIIVVGVALETVRALEAQMLMRNYKGFLS